MNTTVSIVGVIVISFLCYITMVSGAPLYERSEECNSSPIEEYFACRREYNRLKRVDRTTKYCPWIIFVCMTEFMESDVVTLTERSANMKEELQMLKQKLEKMKE